MPDVVLPQHFIALTLDVRDIRCQLAPKLTSGILKRCGFAVQTSQTSACLAHIQFCDMLAPLRAIAVLRGLRSLQLAGWDPQVDVASLPPALKHLDTQKGATGESLIPGPRSTLGRLSRHLRTLDNVEHATCFDRTLGPLLAGFSSCAWVLDLSASAAFDHPLAPLQPALPMRAAHLARSFNPPPALKTLELHIGVCTHPLQLPPTLTCLYVGGSYVHPLSQLPQARGVVPGTYAAAPAQELSVPLIFEAARLANTLVDVVTLR
ncbi:hypothetical protein JKP88DRAFT_289276 [Tribonema minus]|uniref:Uncharacterized protein n=1 Tax=Tribonema minus TaxID=303371 RepID=A0A836CGW0_9STRA|nr:hypothetical protein JKP88DRAFT_289276 [Tribonema minus]